MVHKRRRCDWCLEVLMSHTMLDHWLDMHYMMWMRASKVGVVHMWNRAMYVGK